MSVSKTLTEIEVVGIAFRLDGPNIRVWYPDPRHREEFAGQISFLRSHKGEVVEFLRTRTTIPQMPPGIRLVKWELKEPPVAIEICSVVTDSAKFAVSTLEQLRVALANPKRWVGWAVPQLIDRLSQVGVIVTIEEAGNDR